MNSYSNCCLLKKCNQVVVHFKYCWQIRGSPKIAPQKYYKAIGARTQVLPTSLTSTEEIFALAGVHRITITPGLLQQLSTPIPGPLTASLLDSELPTLASKAISYMNREAEYCVAFSRAEGGADEEKFTQVKLNGNDFYAMRLTSSRTGLLAG